MEGNLKGYAVAKDNITVTLTVANTLTNRQMLAACVIGDEMQFDSTQTELDFDGGVGNDEDN